MYLRSLFCLQPLIARATSCWKLDWDELSNNSANFTALCQQLRDMVNVSKLLFTLSILYVDFKFVFTIIHVFCISDCLFYTSVPVILVQENALLLLLCIKVYINR